MAEHTLLARNGAASFAMTPELEVLITDAWRWQAPKVLVKTMDAPGPRRDRFSFPLRTAGHLRSTVARLAM